MNEKTFIVTVGKVVFLDVAVQAPEGFTAMDAISLAMKDVTDMYVEDACADGAIVAENDWEFNSISEADDAGNAQLIIV
ncbi:hypothetical protein [Micromonospora sp. NBC_01813]|uniref:hypothetical protein n=1 Tax=Micromonospora sp. NBC_01813 TaxID=2975988 RepID=UPI002DD99889|nr:hypothetical protein [Micromonospora sp. NBC_01813]WSA11573.1 hypothetical protein OG958_12760 [Micromonospora sp. NBC_01813]